MNNERKTTTTTGIKTIKVTVKLKLLTIFTAMLLMFGYGDGLSSFALAH